jgi:hypothetical protein
MVRQNHLAVHVVGNKRRSPRRRIVQNPVDVGLHDIDYFSVTAQKNHTGNRTEQDLVRLLVHRAQAVAKAHKRHQILKIADVQAHIDRRQVRSIGSSSSSFFKTFSQSNLKCPALITSRQRVISSRIKSFGFGSRRFLFHM